MKTKDMFLKQLEEMRKQYQTQLPEKLSNLKNLYIEKSSVSLDRLNDIYREIHSLNGSGATFGFPEISECASQMEAYLNNFLDHKENLSNFNYHQFDHLFRGW